MVRNKKRDRISNLPDLLVSHILSFLTIKEAVATSILSSSWKTLWTLVPNLRLDEDEFEWILSDEKQNRKKKKSGMSGMNGTGGFAKAVLHLCRLSLKSGLFAIHIPYKSFTSTGFMIVTQYMSISGSALQSQVTWKSSLLTFVLTYLSTFPVPFLIIVKHWWIWDYMAILLLILRLHPSASQVSKFCIFLESSMPTTTLSQDSSLAAQYSNICV